MIFAFHGYPWLIHRLTYRRTNHANLHVRGYKEEGTTTTPFDMVMLNDLDRYHLVMDVIDRVPGLAEREATLRQHMVDERLRLRALHPRDRRGPPGRRRLALAPAIRRERRERGGGGVSPPDEAADVRARMASLVDAGLALGQELTLDALLTRIVQIGARGAGRALRGPRRAGRRRTPSSPQFVTAGLTEEERAAIGDLPRGRGLLGVLIRDARPLRLERMSDDPRSAGFPPNHPPMESFLGVPVALRGEVFGNLYLTDKAGGPVHRRGRADGR